MTCKECRYFKGGFCCNQDTIVDPEDTICIGYEPRMESSIKCNDCKYFDGIDQCFWYGVTLEECFACMAYEKDEEEELEHDQTK